MASPPLAELAPREPELALAKQSWAEDRPLASCCSSYSWGCNPFPGSWGWVSPPDTLTPAVLAVRVPLIAICAFLQGDQRWPVFTPCPLQLTRALSLATLQGLLQTMAPVAPPTRGGENLPQQQPPQNPGLCVPAQPIPGQWPHGPHRVAVGLLRILGRRCPQEQQQQRPEQ